MKKNILFCGTPEFAVSSLRAVFKYQKKLNYNLLGVITIPDKIAGRGQKMRESAVKSEAKKLNLKIYESKNLSDLEFINQIKNLNLDLMIVVAFQKLPKILFETPRLGTINLHASILPKYRGAAPINWAIINGEEETGLSTFWINEKIDTGDIILQSKINIPIDWHADDLYTALMKKSPEIIRDTIIKIYSYNYTMKKQHIEKDLKAPKIKKEDRILQLKNFASNQKIKKIYNFIRGMSPPGVKTKISIQKQETTITKNMSITRVGQYQKSTNNLQKNEKIKIIKKENELMITNNFDSFKIEKLKLDNGKEMTAKEFINGFIQKNNISLSIVS